MQNLNTLTISSTNPCLMVFLVDQSYSMIDKFGNSNNSKAVEVANAINDNFYEIGLRCIGDSGELKNRFEIAVIAYGSESDKVVSGWEGNLVNKWVVSIKDIFNHPLATENEKPIWIKPKANGNTPMTKAFENANRLCTDWINWGNHRDCHPPIIINITDGDATDSGMGNRNLKNEVAKIKDLRTNYGPVIVLNIHISSVTGTKQNYPETVNTGDSLSQLLFDISSNLNENMVKLAKQAGYNVSVYSKGYVFNGNANDLMHFLNVGTPR